MAIDMVNARRIMASMATQWNLRIKDAEKREVQQFWQERLSEVGVTNENFRSVFKGFCRRWADSRNPRLHDLLKHAKQRVGQHDDDRPRRRHDMERCAFCDDSGAFPVVTPAIMLHTTYSPQDIGYRPGEPWTEEMHRAAESRMGMPHRQWPIEAWSVPCPCTFGQAQERRLFADIDSEMVIALVDLFSPFFSRAYAGEWALEPGRQLSAWSACVIYRRRARQQDWQPSAG